MQAEKVRRLRSSASQNLDKTFTAKALANKSERKKTTWDPLLLNFRMPNVLPAVLLAATVVAIGSESHTMRDRAASVENGIVAFTNGNI